MRKLFSVMVLTTLLATPALAAPNLSSRDQAIRECTAMQRQYGHDSYDPQGGVQYMYDACMANHGQAD